MSTPRRPTPRPPGPAFHASRAGIRDNKLNPEEQTVRDQTTAILQAIARDNELNRSERTAQGEAVPLTVMLGLPAVPDDAPLIDHVNVYKPLLVKNGWEAETSGHPVRVRLEAFHASGAAMMITADVRRNKSQKGRINLYLLRPPGDGQWYKIVPQMLLDVARNPSLPQGIKKWEISTKCQCGKVRHPTHIRAAAALAEVQAKHPGDRREERFYRCEADDRVWHLTKKAAGYERGTPLADAYDATGRYQPVSRGKNPHTKTRS
jgi:hypothetical protein